MPTYQSKNTGGTPTTRASELLTAALAHADADVDKAASNTSTSSRGSLRAILHEAHALVTGTEPYLEQNTSDLIVPSAHPVARVQVHAAWNDLLEVTQRTDWVALKDEGKTRFELGAGMCSGPYEAVVLQNLALLQRTRSVLEIGTFTGTATLAFALLPSVEKVVALDIEPYLAELVTPYWQRAGTAQKIDFKIAPALESLADLSKQQHAPFDLVFIDADKPSYKAYVQAVLDGGLLSENGVILADNTMYKGFPWATPGAHEQQATTGATVAEDDFAQGNRTNNRSKSEATTGIADFNTYVREHSDLETVMLPIRDGITIIRRKL
ncbi:hypothetical protein BMF94_1282 [Rhodotorula taiwanensis]|uniref:Caffeoyl-CoA O-methyltransferase n=1 Tax=Rhodotorula taiwanensis TaxID=741276 RepID=A0A2S5BFW3_9BASI|nr:hypothetical protein BMF94_1282 [Rhodotorula taiwanensis]